MRTDFGSVRVAPSTGRIGPVVARAGVSRFNDDGSHPKLVVLDTDKGKQSLARNRQVEVPLRSASLRSPIRGGYIIPSGGGNAIWVDMKQGYESLDEETKDLLEHRTATHSLRNNKYQYFSPDKSVARLEAFPDQHHPLARIHSNTGRRSFFVSEPLLTGADAMDFEKGSSSLTRLIGRVAVPTIQVPFCCETKSFAMQEYKGTESRAERDLVGYLHMEGVGLLGDRPLRRDTAR